MSPDNIDTLVVQVRADTSNFMAGVGDIQRTLDGPFASGLDRAGSGLSRALGRALADGESGFDGLRRVALAALGDISRNALRLDLGALTGGGQSGGGVGGIASLLGGLFGLPGRAIGGPVAPGRPFVVGERGPELFVPTAAGQVLPNPAGGSRPVSITVNVAAPREASAAVMQQTGNQVARAVTRALQRAQS